MTVPSSVHRACIALLAASAVVVGGWAAFLPMSFYADFPSPGRRWVSTLGPYNEHLIRDVGSMYLALFVLSAWAWWRPEPRALRMTGAAWLVFNGLHLAWHAGHLAAFPLIDRIGNAVSLAAVLAASVLLVLPARAVSRPR
jgi:hypothetical protein